MTGIRLELERSGGFGGLALPPWTLDTADLSPQAADEIAELVAAVERLLEPTAPPPRHPDATRYDITVRRGGQLRRLSFDDVTATPDARRLIERIESDGARR